MKKNDKNSCLEDTVLNSSGVNKYSHHCEGPFLINPRILMFMVGVFGIILPFILPFGQWLSTVLDPQNTITALCNHSPEDYKAVFQCTLSDYYFSYVRSLFVGLLCVIGVFLISYHGYDEYKGVRNFDNKLSSVAGMAALGVAIFPTSTSIDVTRHELMRATQGFDVFHYLCAIVLFAILTFMSLCLFTESDQAYADMSVRKRLRNRIYRGCGYVMLLCMLAIVVVFVLKKWGGFGDFVFYHHEIYLLESILVVCFGVSWMVKSQFILADKDR